MVERQAHLAPTTLQTQQAGSMRYFLELRFSYVG